MDLGIEEAHATEGTRKRIKAAVVASAGKLGLEIPNIGSTRSRREYNRYELPLPSIMQSDEPGMLIIETAVMTPASPAKVRQIWMPHSAAELRFVRGSRQSRRRRR